MSWETQGNAGTNPPNDFLGTTDAQPLVIKTGGDTLGTIQRLQIEAGDPSMTTLTLFASAPTAQKVGDRWIPGPIPIANKSWAISASKSMLSIDPQVGGADVAGVSLLASGNVGIGTATPGATLDVNGGVQCASVQVLDDVALVNGRLGVGMFAKDITAKLDVNGDAHVSGNVNVDGDVVLTGPGADCAEDFDISETEKVEPGTVMVLDKNGALRQSGQAYDKRVAGVISGAGEFKPAITLDKQRDSSKNRLPVALVGKVFCKVDAQYSCVEVGDLLTTSPTPGCAMKAADPLKAFGAVIGKALRPLQSGQGLIPILVALQ